MFCSCRHSICLISSLIFRGGYVHNIIRMMSISLLSSFLLRKEHWYCSNWWCQPFSRSICCAKQISALEERYALLTSYSWCCIHYFLWSYLDTTGNIIILFWSFKSYIVWAKCTSGELGSQVDCSSWHISIYIARCSLCTYIRYCKFLCHQWLSSISISRNEQ
jgi:hypothetical protein